MLPNAIFSTWQSTQNPDTMPTLPRAKNANALPTHPADQNLSSLVQHFSKLHYEY